MTQSHDVYSFHCKNKKKCYWKTEDYQLKIRRNNHVMLTVPSSLVSNCGCEVNATPCGCKDPVPIDKCTQCQDGFWRLNENGCQSKYDFYKRTYGMFKLITALFQP